MKISRPSDHVMIVQQVSFSRVNNIIIQSSRIGEHNTLGYRVAIVRADGKDIPFSPAYSGGEKALCENIAEEVMDFISIDSNVSIMHRQTTALCSLPT